MNKVVKLILKILATLFLFGFGVLVSLNIAIFLLIYRSAGIVMIAVLWAGLIVVDFCVWTEKW